MKGRRGEMSVGIRFKSQSPDTGRTEQTEGCWIGVQNRRHPEAVELVGPHHPAPAILVQLASGSRIPHLLQLRPIHSCLSQRRPSFRIHRDVPLRAPPTPISQVSQPLRS